jgi:hypothetical protein
MLDDLDFTEVIEATGQSRRMVNTLVKSAEPRPTTLIEQTSTIRALR